MRRGVRTISLHVEKSERSDERNRGIFSGAA